MGRADWVTSDRDRAEIGKGVMVEQSHPRLLRSDHREELSSGSARALGLDLDLDLGLVGMTCWCCRVTRRAVLWGES